MAICLNMIVRDEAAVIERCLASVRPFIDSWLIVDTGSLDDTPQRIGKALAGIPGQLHHRPWRNFGHNRSEALELARSHADYLLFIDADEQLGAAAGAAWPTLSEPAYSLEARYGELSYDRVSLVSTALPWRWVGVLHEYLDAGQAVAQPRIPGFWIAVTPDGARSADPHKFEKDAAMLAAALQEEPDNTRYVFYLAQSYRDSQQLEKSLEAYIRRAAMGGWEEEAWYSLYMAARLSERLKLSNAVVTDRYLQAYQYRPSRAEPLVDLARYCREQGQHALAHLFAARAIEIPRPPDRLFVDEPAYAWRSLDEYALASYWQGNYAESERANRVLLSCGRLPVHERPRILDNLNWALRGQGLPEVTLQAAEQNASPTTPSAQVRRPQCHLLPR